MEEGEELGRREELYQFSRYTSYINVQRYRTPRRSDSKNFCYLFASLCQWFGVIAEVSKMHQSSSGEIMNFDAARLFPHFQWRMRVVRK